MNLIKLMAASAVMVAAGNLASAQNPVAAPGDLPPGRAYIFHSTAQAGCPALDWHVILQADNTLLGMLAWDDMKVMARAKGKLNTADRTFQMEAVEVGGQGRTAIIDGTLRRDGWVVVDVTAPNLTCKGIDIAWHRLE